jgi:hypothetical protein
MGPCRRIRSVVSRLMSCLPDGWERDHRATPLVEGTGSEHTADCAMTLGNRKERWYLVLSVAALLDPWRMTGI